MAKRLFQTLDEMNVADEKNKTVNVGVCPDLVRADKVKAGVHVTIGAPSDQLIPLMNGEVIPILLLINKAEYDKISKQ